MSRCFLLPLMLLALLVAAVSAQPPGDDLNRKLVQSYDLLEAGKLEQAKNLYREILKQHPDHPLALNNLAAILVKQGSYDQALDYLRRALQRAQGYKVLVNKVCDINQVCLAFRTMPEAYGDTVLAPLIQFNIDLVEAHKAGSRE
jgi:tetratricopeptide (TPR) repeat protein